MQFFFGGVVLLIFLSSMVSAERVVLGLPFDARYDTSFEGKEYALQLESIEPGRVSLRVTPEGKRASSADITPRKMSYVNGLRVYLREIIPSPLIGGLPQAEFIVGDPTLRLVVPWNASTRRNINGLAYEITLLGGSDEQAQIRVEDHLGFSDTRYVNELGSAQMRGVSLMVLSVDEVPLDLDNRTSVAQVWADIYIDDNASFSTCTPGRKEASRIGVLSKRIINSVRVHLLSARYYESTGTVRAQIKVNNQTANLSAPGLSSADMRIGDSNYTFRLVNGNDREAWIEVICIPLSPPAPAATESGAPLPESPASTQPTGCEGCLEGEQCIEFGTRQEQTFCAREGTLAPQRGTGETCNENYECQSELCEEGICKKRSILSRMGSWFKGLVR